MADPFFKDLAFAALAQTARNPTGDFNRSVLGAQQLQRPAEPYLRQQYPEVYGGLGGFMGMAPDEMGGSVLDPNTARVRAGAQIGFPIGTATQVLPALNLIRPAVKAGARALGPTAVSMGEGYLQRQGLMPGVVEGESAGMLGGPIKPQSGLTNNEILEQFWKDLDKAGDGYIGVRADDAIVKNSFRKSWNRPDQVKTTRLPGTSVMGVGQDNITKEKLLEAIKNARGYGKNVYLLEGKSPTDMQYLANDPGERLLSDNKILSAVFDESAGMRGGVKKGQPLFTAAPIGGIGLGAGTQDNNQPVQQAMNEFEQSLINFMATPAK